MMPGFARIDEVASFSNERGIERACALEIVEIKIPKVDIREINFRLSI